ncbi:serine acetyltransferase [Fulvivirgaceae bacterium PWU4]|uniref:Serine acetyltransferase n=1 Tax=Chryseosolibacter histidini TaxID=2782349 RepID=A0AAP2DK50_9BACT|nr:serine O-acetyltransferase EpsC [Chryseosolibacter histidini]MBT1697861.1 serine acetyltransferase [Chryseosolibacter histidini]
MDKAFLAKLFRTHQACPICPSPAEVSSFFSDLLGTLFADFSQTKFPSPEDFERHIETLKADLIRILQYNPERENGDAARIAAQFFDNIPALYDTINDDVTAMYEGDPAARSRNEVIRTYPGFYAIAAYRIAHALLTLRIHEIPRIITEHAHSRTGIDIHPGATIGKHFCIDHGTGVVIGETTVIGDNVKIYQGVTLGALSVSKEDAEKKRHPTLEDGVVVYAGATILGGETVIGHDSVIGGNVWLTKSVPPYSKIYYQAKMYNHDSGHTDVVVFRSDGTGPRY